MEKLMSLRERAGIRGRKEKPGSLGSGWDNAIAEATRGTALSWGLT